MIDDILDRGLAAAATEQAHWPRDRPDDVPIPESFEELAVIQARAPDGTAETIFAPPAGGDTSPDAWVEARADDVVDLVEVR